MRDSDTKKTPFDVPGIFLRATRLQGIARNL